MEVDPRFKAARAQAAKRRRRNILRPILLWGGGAAVVVGLPLLLFLTGILTFGTAPPDGDDSADTGADDPAAVAYASPFIDVAGDPMRLRFDRSAGAENRSVLLRPPGIPPMRAGSDLVLVRDTMITAQDRLITTLPSSREDFAFFQAQRQAAPEPAAATPPRAAPAGNGELVEVAGTASWGETMGGDDAPETFVRTRIENTTSLAYLQREDRRQAAFEDVFLRLRGPRGLQEIMTANGFDEGAATRFAESAIARLPELGELGAGHILALRGAWRGGTAPEPVQLSAYTSDSYIGSLALDDTGTVRPAADPWVGRNLFSFAGTPEAAQGEAGLKYRLLDAFYSAAMRNGVPSGIVGETIVLMSQGFDLESFARPGDTMVLLYARDPGAEGTGPGQVLYAAIEGPGRRLDCLVYRLPGSDYRCYGQGGRSGGGASLRAGMATPVQGGVLTSGYGPRQHPILKTVKLHRGVDWAAPTGTPVVAAFDGTIAAAGDAGGYGNLVRITHPDGTETRYAHLDRFAETARAGGKVRAGEVIGFVGTTGLSTGPHLHFELYENGQSVDPFAGGGSLTAGSAVDQLTDRIIRVESGGRADAKNPLSSATGLGQFINSTWLRMMRTYRPDLAAAMSDAELLALRTDPTISREMVQHLARESESYLSARGHAITAGRLYLAHFLGAEGAHLVLTSPDDAPLLEVLGASVINANPFLKGHDVAYIKAWSNRKMRSAGTAAPPPLPAAVRSYQQIIRQVVQRG